MPVVHVALEGGFEGDEVEVRVADRVVRRSGVTTLTVIGLAEQVDVDVPAGPCTVTVTLPERGLSTAVDVTAGADVLVRVSRTTDGLTAEPTVEPYGWA